MDLPAFGQLGARLALPGCALPAPGGDDDDDIPLLTLDLGGEAPAGCGVDVVAIRE